MPEKNNDCDIFDALIIKFFKNHFFNKINIYINFKGKGKTAKQKGKNIKWKSKKRKILK